MESPRQENGRVGRRDRVAGSGPVTPLLLDISGLLFKAAEIDLIESAELTALEFRPRRPKPGKGILNHTAREPCADRTLERDRGIVQELADRWLEQLPRVHSNRAQGESGGQG